MHNRWKTQICKLIYRHTVTHSHTHTKLQTVCLLFLSHPREKLLCCSSSLWETIKDKIFLRCWKACIIDTLLKIAYSSPLVIKLLMHTNICTIHIEREREIPIFLYVLSYIGYFMYQTFLLSTLWSLVKTWDLMKYIQTSNFVPAVFWDHAAQTVVILASVPRH